MPETGSSRSQAMMYVLFVFLFSSVFVMPAHMPADHSG